MYYNPLHRIILYEVREWTTLMRDAGWMDNGYRSSIEY